MSEEVKGQKSGDYRFDPHVLTLTRERGFKQVIQALCASVYSSVK